MADVRIRERDAAEFRDAMSALSRLADDYESEGLTPDEFAPRLLVVREHLDDGEAAFRKALREAG